MKKVIRRLGVFTLLVSAIVACEITTTPAELEETAEVVDENLQAETNVLRVFENVNNYGFSSSNSVKSTLIDADVPIQIWDGNILTLDFKDIVGATGKIIASFSAVPAYSDDIEVNITFNEYEYNGISITGTLLLSITSVEDGQEVVFAFATLGNVSISDAEKTFDWNCNQTINWVQGVSTASDNTDDEFLINGNTNQIATENSNEVVLVDILYANNCDFIKSGELHVTKGNESKITICDFGVDASGNESEECNGYAQLSSEGVTYVHNFEN